MQNATKKSQELTATARARKSTTDSEQRQRGTYPSGFSSLLAGGFSKDIHIVADFDSQRALASLETLKGKLS